jgi:signal transduction histidine kinase
MQKKDGGEGSRAADVLAEVTHETRRPLGLARGYLSTVLEEQLGSLTPSQRSRLRRVDEKLAEALAELDHRLVLLSKLELNEVRGGTELDPIDLLAGVQSAIDRARVRLDLVSGHVELRQAPRPVRARADSLLLARVLDNLLENALIYTKAPPRLTVEVGVARSGRPFVRVADQGTGMTPETAARIFEEGFRGEPSGGRAGTGLGLWLSRRAAEQMEGHLELEATQPGRGSVFRLELQPDQTDQPLPE